MDFSGFCREYGIPVAGTHDKHYRYGWVNVECPFCVGHDGHHLGYNEDKSLFTCWRCGFKSAAKVFTKISHLPFREALQEAKRYGWTKPDILSPHLHAKTESRPFHLPPGSKSVLTTSSIKYLKKRGYDPEEVSDVWRIQNTGIIGSHKYRIVIPIHYNGKVVSWTSRYTRKSTGQPKYKSCPTDMERIPHKNLLYGWDYVSGITVIVVEGPLDVWRLGPGAVATFGIEWTYSQLGLLSRFQRVFFAYDKETMASRKAEQALQELSLMGVPFTQMIELDRDDPGVMSEKEANKLMAEVLM